MITENSKMKVYRWAYYNDTDKLDFELYIIFRTLHWFDDGVSQHKNPIRYISVEDLLEIIQNASKTIKSLLETEDL
jgi:hypothetical protein